MHDGEGAIVRWWCAKYRLPPNHHLLLSRTIEDVQTEMVTDWLIEHRALESEIRKIEAVDSRRVADTAYQRLDVLRRALGLPPVIVEDPLLTKWEREIESGHVPDLEEGLSPKMREKLKKDREKWAAKEAEERRRGEEDKGRRRS